MERLLKAVLKSSTAYIFYVYTTILRVGNQEYRGYSPNLYHCCNHLKWVEIFAEKALLPMKSESFSDHKFNHFQAVAQAAIQAGSNLEFEKAVTLFDEALQLKPEMPDLHYGRAYSLMQSGELRGAHTSLSNCLALNPKYIPARVLEVELEVAAQNGQVANVKPDQRVSLRELAKQDPSRTTFLTVPGIDPNQRASQMVRLKDFYLCGRHAFIVSPDGVPLTEQSQGTYYKGYDLDLTEKILNHLPNLLGAATTLPGSYVNLAGPFAYNFFHWFVESVPRLLFAERLGFTGTYIIPSEAPFPRETLELLGIPPTRMIETGPGCYRVEELSVSMLYNIDDAVEIPNLYRELRDRLSAAVFGTKKPEAEKRIYISRGTPSEGRARVVADEERLIELLSKYGFKKYQMEHLSLSEQLQTTLQTAAIVGAHGAGNVHSMFMAPGGILMELFTPSYIDYGPAQIAAALGHDYKMIVSELNRDETPDERVITPPFSLLKLMMEHHFQSGGTI